VVGLARDEKGRQTIRRLGGESVVGDIFDAGSLAAAVGQADVVIHAATSIPARVSGDRAGWELNDRLRREGTRALTEAAARAGAKTYIQQSVVWVARPSDDSFFEEKTAVGSRARCTAPRSTGSRSPPRRARSTALTSPSCAAAGSTPRTRTTRASSPRACYSAGCRFAVVTEREDAPPGYAGKLVTLFQLDGEGLIERIYFVMASRKLKALPAVGVAEAEAGR
jgi:hypothetical protein